MAASSRAGGSGNRHAESDPLLFRGWQRSWSDSEFAAEQSEMPPATRERVASKALGANVVAPPADSTIAPSEAGCEPLPRSASGSEAPLGDCVTLHTLEGDRRPLSGDLRTLEDFLACLRKLEDGSVGTGVPNEQARQRHFVCVFGKGSSETFIEQCRGILAGRYQNATVKRMTWGTFLRRGAGIGAGVGAGAGAAAGLGVGLVTVPVVALLLMPLWAIEGAVWGTGIGAGAGAVGAAYGADDHVIVVEASFSERMSTMFERA
eukprot:gnl/TRDRNA2_/TRDRNA2_39698_c0_seq1.p1 gnl/TRDRNA2_/TRDRNA2_39698_c0~~gnl/TRDRNA2_/TRDRNA2_39698_c0_seq1.p1  ORF type:complete len:301 (-),score=46.48 gnl/TRDRNA2_/TRDRNA2_39698_c0_seq1:80-868(-)